MGRAFLGLALLAACRGTPAARGQSPDLARLVDSLRPVVERAGDLAALLNQSASHPWPLPRVLHVLEQICAALEAMWKNCCQKQNSNQKNWLDG